MNGGLWWAVKLRLASYATRWYKKMRFHDHGLAI